MTETESRTDPLYVRAPAAPAAWVAGLNLAMTIGGQDCLASRSLDVIDPAGRGLVCAAPSATIEDVDEAVAAATASYPHWSGLAVEERRRLLEGFAQRLEDQAETLCVLLTAETGKPLRLALSEVQAGIAFVRIIAAQILPVRDYVRADGGRATLEARPLGVVAAIAPWNGPVVLAVAKIANALIAGNCLVLKPSPYTPLTALYMGQLARGLFPSGVFNVVAGDGDVGGALVAHPGIAKISFTGSTQTGRRIAAAAAPTLKRLTLELGGNDAAIVLPDADLDRAASIIFAIAFLGSGQFCAAVKRLYVHEDIFVDLRDRLVAKATQTCVGSGWDPASDMGPVQSGAQFDRLASLFEDTVSRGGRVHCGGPLYGRPGFFIEPAIVDGVNHGARVVDEEQFGPILPMIPFNDVGDALAMANRSEYGLGGSVWTADIDAGLALARQLHVGTAWVNQHGAFSAALPMPFAGQSGIGMDYADCGVADHSRFMLINPVR